MIVRQLRPPRSKPGVAWNPTREALASCASDTASDPVDEPTPTGNVAQFYARWPEFHYILRYEEHFDPYLWVENLRYELALAAGDRLVPDAVQAEWEVAVDIQRRRMTMFRENHNRLDVDEVTAFAEWGVIPWDEAKAASDAALEDIQRWADANCDTSVLTLGAPGTVAVRYKLQPELGSRTLVSVLLPAGTEFAEIDSLSPYRAAWCSTLGDFGPEMQQQDMPTQTLRPIDGQGEYFKATCAISFVTKSKR